MRHLFVPTSPTVLVYHGVPRNGEQFNAADFERQLEFLAAHFELISIMDLEHSRRRSARIQVLLTFDDGFRNNFDIVAPMLRQRRIPAIFFVCSRPAECGRVLWFAYLAMLGRYYSQHVLRFRGEDFDMTPGSRVAALDRLRDKLVALRPHPSAMYDAIANELPPIESFTTAEERTDECEGMSEEQVTELACDPLFTIGAHTKDHPFLTKCPEQEALTQIEDNKQWIEKVTGRDCRTIAYPASDYNTQVLRMTAQMGFEWAFSAGHKVAGEEERMQVPRVGIYYPSLTELGFKVCWGRALETLQRRKLVPASV
jgi:peptidoglycan/xylan/chitin deacetylase (PgdA/CDA1 family)